MKALGAGGLLAAVGRNLASAQTYSDYKALVCIFQQGGNDGDNTLIRFDSPGYQNYASVRPPASNLNIPQSQLLPIQPARGGPPFGFHPACAPLRTLFEQRRLAVVANVGVLAAPVTRAGLQSQGAPRPANLFSHTDQELCVQSADPGALNRVGWGGRIADRLDAQNAAALFPPLISIAGMKTFTTGATSIPLAVPPSPYFALNPSGDFQFDALREAALRSMLARQRRNVYDVVAQVLTQDGLAASSVVNPMLANPNSVVAPFFANLDNATAWQLRTVALLLEGRAQLGLKRQVFFVNQGGYDTHGEQLGLHQGLLAEFARAVAAFQGAVGALGLTDSVTTFTLSDFGRTFKPAAGNGTDHGWGGHAFVIGGAVKGGDFYGTLPTQALNGPDDFGKDGRWIPTISIEQYGATLARWFGIAEGDLPYVFPNIGAFASTNLGFMT